MTSAQTTDDHDPAGSEELGLRELKKRQTRMAMHRAALELVVEHGLSAVTAQMIQSTPSSALAGVAAPRTPRSDIASRISSSCRMS